MAGSLIYTNARVKTLENTFLTGEKITRMAHADDVSEAVKVLIESGYGGGRIAAEGDFEDVLAAEEERVAAFLREALASYKGGLESLLFEYDYHNAKALTKAKYGRISDPSDMLAPTGFLATDKLKEDLFADEYGALAPQMAVALKAIDALEGDGKLTPSDIDILLDKAMFAHGLEVVKKAKASGLIAYWQANADMGNVSAFWRYKASGADKKAFEYAFIEGGLIAKETFTGTYDAPIGEFCEKLKYTAYGGAISDAVGEGDIATFEKEWDNKLIEIFKSQKNDLFSIAPIAGFYVGKKIEIKTVRMLLVMLKNGIDGGEINRRLRDFYA